MNVVNLIPETKSPAGYIELLRGALETACKEEMVYLEITYKTREDGINSKSIASL